MHYYGTRLSENISKREPEGYLLCLNVPVARTGTQEYLPEELGLMPNSEFIIHNSELSPAGGLVKVFRPEEEVFSEATMASFEGMPCRRGMPTMSAGAAGRSQTSSSPTSSSPTLP